MQISACFLYRGHLRFYWRRSSCQWRGRAMYPASGVEAAMRFVLLLRLIIELGLASLVFPDSLRSVGLRAPLWKTP